MTKRQIELLKELHDKGFIEHSPYFGRSQSNGPLYTLINDGLAYWGWGPKRSWLRTQGFFPLWTDPVV